MKLLATIFLLFAAYNITAQPTYKEDKKFSAALGKIVNEAKLDSVFNVGQDGTERISLAVIDMSGKPVLGGVNMDNFIYPASVYKMYVAMEVLKQVSNGQYKLDSQYIVRAPNTVDKRSEVGSDPRPVLLDGDTVTINYLLDLMITRSDNTAANCLIDIAMRPNINATLHAFGWKGSEVTRKFLSRKFEDPGYDTVRGTETCALHAADFMYRVHTNQLVNPWVSMQMKALLGRQLDKTKLAKGLPTDVMFYHKSGWWSTYTNDIGIADNGKLKYVIALFVPIREEAMDGRMQLLAQKIHALVEKRNTKSRK